MTDIGENEIATIRAQANPVLSGNIDAFIESWGFPLYIEPKHDGERAWIMKRGDYIIAFNKRNSVYDDSTHYDFFNYKLRDFADSYVIEGELCSKKGGLYAYLSSRRSGEHLILHAFDCLELNGMNMRDVPLEIRKANLRSNPLSVVPLFEVKTKEELLAKKDELIGNGFEGVVIKSPKQRYGEGYWLKIKREETIDAVILGIKKKDKYAEDGLARSFRLGLNNGNGYTWIGDVGSGLSIKEKMALTQVLEATVENEDKDYIYTKPRFVLEITADSKSEDRHLIHPRVKRIRNDKAAEECKLEQLNLLVERK